MIMLPCINDIPLTVDRLLTERGHYEQARRHKNNRINKKWRKRYGLRWVVDEIKMLQYGNGYIVHPDTYAEILAQMDPQ